MLFRVMPVIQWNISAAFNHPVSVVSNMIATSYLHVAFESWDYESIFKGHLALMSLDLSSLKWLGGADLTVWVWAVLWFPFWVIKAVCDTDSNIKTDPSCTLCES